MTPYLLGIAGGTASGKSTFARRLVQCAGGNNACVIELDWYYRSQADLDFAQRTRGNYDHPDAVEFSLLVEHLEKLRSGSDIECPVYDFTQHNRAAGRAHRIAPCPVVIVEGILLFAQAEVRALFDKRFFTTAPDQERLNRRMERDVRERGRTRESVLQQWQASVHPMHEQFCEPSKIFADKFIENCGGSDAEVQVLWSEIWQEATLGGTR